MICIEKIQTVIQYICFIEAIKVDEIFDLVQREVITGPRFLVIRFILDEETEYKMNINDNNIFRIMDRAPREKTCLRACAKCADSHHPAMRKDPSGHLFSIDIFLSIQWFCLQTVKVLIMLRG